MLVGAVLAVLVGPWLAEVSATDGPAAVPIRVKHWRHAALAHGGGVPRPLLTAILEGMPAHVQVTSADIADALARRRLGYGRGARMKFEQDEVRLTGGVRHGRTQGGPISIEIGNTEWPKWEQVMSADPVDPVELEAHGPQRGR